MQVRALRSPVEFVFRAYVAFEHVRGLVHRRHAFVFAKDQIGIPRVRILLLQVLGALDVLVGLRVEQVVG